MQPQVTIDDRYRLLLVGNSVSMSPMDGVAGYPELLQTRLQDKWKIFTIIRGGQTVDELETEILAELEAIQPHVLTLQIGVNECGPRPLSRQERARLGTLRPRWIRAIIIRILHKFRARIIRARGLNQFTSVSAFAETVNRIIARALSLQCTVLILPITHVSAIAEIRQPFFNREIDRYNEILRSLKMDGVVYLAQHDLFESKKPEEFCVTPESVHLNRWAHERLAAALCDCLQRQISASHSMAGEQS